VNPDEKSRLVLDTNIIISGLISKRGAPAVLLDAFEKKNAILLLSDSVLAEYLKVLNYPKIRKYLESADELVAHFAALFVGSAERIEVSSRVNKSPDPDDNKFLELAMDGGADFLVSGDKTDLLSLKIVGSTPIVTAAQCVERLKLAPK
jgi:uncharacterized protein